MLRVGLGFDIHAFARPPMSRPLVLGGVLIPDENGLQGHSDADVLVHSICDAVLGALALGDLGSLFPDTDERYRGVSSLVLLEKVAELMTGRGYRLINLDAVVIAQHPRVAPHFDRMRQRIAAALGATVAEVSVKAASPEGVGSLGRKEGIAAESIALIGMLGRI